MRRLLTPACAAAALCMASTASAVEPPKEPKNPATPVAAAGTIEQPETTKPQKVVRSIGTAPEHRVLQRNPAGKPTIIHGNLGKLEYQGLRGNGNLKAVAQQKLKGLSIDMMGATGLETLLPNNQVIAKDKAGKSHIRFEEEIHGMKVEGASMVMHLDKDDNVFALNGEFVSEDSIPTEAELDCEAAMISALQQSGIEDGEWLTDCELTVIYGADGNGHLAWKRLIGFNTENGQPQKDVLFASATTGALVAHHPKLWNARSLTTKNCGQTTYYCPVASTSSSMINTGDDAIDGAHNHAFDVYNYFSQRFGRDSMDDFGMTIESSVHYDFNLVQAYWDSISQALYYGDGDGKFTHQVASQTFLANLFSVTHSFYCMPMTGIEASPLSEALDVVAHEYTHGITSHESNLIYQYESGALNEAMSDIMAAAVDRWAGASITDTWLVGEDVWTPNIAGDALRSMSNPTLSYDVGYDYYPERYQGSEDNGGVHWNSGIANLAFVLMVQGGQHPRGKTTIQVPAIDSNFDDSMDIASEIFYNANTQCLTPSSNFEAIRFCTAEVVSESIYRDSINAAWEAVGVSGGGNSNAIVLTSGVPLDNQEGQTGDVQQYVLEDVSAGATITCSLVGSNGDADLYLRFGGETGPEADYDCASFSPTSIEECTVGPAASTTDLYAAIHAFSEYSGLQITCSTDGTNPGDVDVTLVLLTDKYPEETMVMLEDLTTNDIFWADQVFSSLETVYTLTQTVDSTHCLAFYIYDSVGDGICCSYGAGSFDLLYDGQSVFSGGEFGDSASTVVGGGCV